MISSRTIFSYLCTALVAAGFYACQEKKETLFSVMDADNTGIHFENKVNLSDTFNILDYLYYYNGGGVAVGDLDGDGLEDIYFTANRESNKLYRNKGNLQFEDITKKAGVAGKGNWNTGVTMADVNGDGLLDIYLCAVGGYRSLQGRNQLFINKGGMRFSEEAAAYGLDVEGFNTQASFFDYDRDGDLDMFLVNHSVHSVESYGDSSLRSKPNAASGDKLFRNNGPDVQPRFTEVTSESGIFSSALGYGLNVLTADFTGDGWDDIYVSNDFHEHDYYYINQQDGRFKEMSRSAFGHQSRFSMGADVADLNGDGWLDIITLDMLPADEKTLKSSAGDDPLDIYEFKFNRGYHHQYARNCLQVNGGAGTAFREIGLFAGVAATDWSWSPLLADFNNDGIRDLFISNGIPRRPNDLDFIKYVSSGSMNTSLQQGKDADAKAISAMPEGKVPNAVFEGSQNMQFLDRGQDWGFDAASLSNGAAYADLDKDGDLDLVVNNLNAPASIYRNNAEKENQSHFLQVRLSGVGENKFGLGARLALWQDGHQQTSVVTATRGFQSASSTIVHFGLGQKAKADSLVVVWPDGMKQVLTGFQVDTILQVVQQHAALIQKEGNVQKPLFTEQANSIVPFWAHEENTFNDFNIQQLIPRQVSAEGPKIAIGDVNRDGFDDLFVCGGVAQAGALYMQNAAGKWTMQKQPAFEIDVLAEDVAALFFDADGDKDADLYVVSGGNEYNETDTLLRDRLYLNDGQGHFTKGLLPQQLGGNRSVVAASDMDHDGDQDLFVGSRVVAGRYGEMPVSHLLLNNGKGRFSIAPEALAPGLQHIGMITAATWTDIDRDGWSDLVVVGEWMPITVYKNSKGALTNATKALGLEATTGLWSALTAEDLDGDGWPELLVGNRGLNSKLQASSTSPLLLYTGDADGNGAPDQVLAVAKNNTYFPFLGKEELERAMPGLIRKQFIGYADMAGRTVDDIFGQKLTGMNKLSAGMLASVMVQNKGGKLLVSPLPENLQWSPVNAFALLDVDGNGVKDIIAAGNLNGVLPYEGRYDAGGLNLLLQQKTLQPVLPFQSGLPLDGAMRDVKVLRSGSGKTYLVAAANNGPLRVFVTGR